jgi:hypothetical protein
MHFDLNDWDEWNFVGVLIQRNRLVKTCLIRTWWVVLTCCVGSHLLSGMNDWHLEKLGQRVKLEQNCLVQMIWGVLACWCGILSLTWNDLYLEKLGWQVKLDLRPFRVNKSFTTYPLGAMGHGTWDIRGRTWWDVPHYGINRGGMTHTIWVLAWSDPWTLRKEDGTDHGFWKHGGTSHLYMGHPMSFYERTWDVPC